MLAGASAAVALRGFESGDTEGAEQRKRKKYLASGMLLTVVYIW